MNYEGKIYWDGEAPFIQTKQKFIEWLEKYPKDQWFSFQVAPIGLEATNQSKLYFKWRDILAEEFGWDNNAMHNHLKKTYNEGKSTKNMSVEQWSEYMSKILAFAGDSNITLPMGE